MATATRNTVRISRTSTETLQRAKICIPFVEASATLVRVQNWCSKQDAGSVDLSGKRHVVKPDYSRERSSACLIKPSIRFAADLKMCPFGLDAVRPLATFPVLLVTSNDTCKRKNVTRRRVT